MALIERGQGGVIDRTLAPTVALQPLHAHDAAHPGCEVAAGIEARQLAVGDQEGLLHEILGLGGGPAQRHGIAEQAPVVLPHQDLEGQTVGVGRHGADPIAAERGQGDQDMTDPLPRFTRGTSPKWP